MKTYEEYKRLIGREVILKKDIVQRAGHKCKHCGKYTGRVIVKKGSKYKINEVKSLSYDACGCEVGITLIPSDGKWHMFTDEILADEFSFDGTYKLIEGKEIKNEQMV